MTGIVECQALTKSFGGAVPAVDVVSLSVDAGEAVGIVGESGSGKSTLARMLAGVLSPTSGSVLINGQSWSEISRRDSRRRSVQMVFQDPSGALNPWMTARETVAEAARHWERLSKAEARARASELLAETGLTPATMDRRPRELSGGQCQRVGIARALACRPTVIIADEPTSALDVSVQAQILNTLLDLGESHRLTLILISHDLGVVRYMTDRALVMHRGRVVEHDVTSKLFTSPSHPYTQQLLRSIPGHELNEPSQTEPATGPGNQV